MRSRSSRDGAAAFFFAHAVQPLDGIVPAPSVTCFSSALMASPIVGRIQRARQLQDDVQVGLGAHAEFFGDVAKGPQIAADQFAVHREAGAASALHGDGDFEVSAVQPLFEHAADLHLDGVELRRACAGAGRGSGG